MKRIFAFLLFTLLLCGITGGAYAAETTLSIDVFDAAGKTPIEGATVKLVAGSDSWTLITGASGAADFPDTRYPQTYQVTVSKAGYESQTDSIDVTESNRNAAFYLTAETPVLLTVTASGKPVAGADVTINNKAAGKTDADGRIHADMTRGTYNTIAVTAVSYLPYHEELYLNADKTAHEIKLTLSTVTPIILVYSEDKDPVSGASIKINGATVGYTDSYGKAQLQTYPAGTYNITVEAVNYVPYIGTVEFSSSIPSTAITLSQSAATVTVKALDGTAPVADTIIYFDGNVKGITAADGTYKASVAPGTSLYISASHEGYTAESITYTVQAGVDNVVIIELKQNIPIVMIGIGVLAVLVLLIIAVLVISGKKRGRKPAKSPANSYPPTHKRDSL